MSQSTLQQITKQPITTMTEKEKVAADTLSKDQYLNKYSRLTKNEINILVTLETGIDIFEQTLLIPLLGKQSTLLKPLKRYAKLWKQQVVSLDGKGRKEIVELFKVEREYLEAEKKRLSERIFTVK